MKRQSIHNYFRFAFNFRRLLDGPPIGTAVRGESSLEFALQDFFDRLSELELRVTEVASSDLREILKELSECDIDEKIDEDLSSRIAKECKKFRTTLRSEISLTYAYTTTEKRTDIETLTDNIGRIFAARVFESLPDLCQFDFREAGRCIAFERPTAAAFHLMRAIEGYLKHYYLQIVKRNRLTKPMWHGMVDQLRRRRDSPPEPILNHLDHIRVSFRNPTQHPDARYDIEEVQDLLSLSIDVANRISRDLKVRGK